MGKKIKPTSLLDSSIDPAQELAPSQQNDTFEDVSLVGNGVMTAEAKAKLEKYDALEKLATSLAKEKDELEAKLAEYAEKLAELKDASTKIAKLEKENETLAQKLKEAESSGKDTSKLALENKALRDEADGYLVRISELTFENANLTCQLDELGKKMRANGIAPNQRKFSPNGAPLVQGGLRQPNADAFNPYASNGYSSWN